MRAVVSHIPAMIKQSAFAANLKALRQAKGWTQQKLADEVGTSKGYLSLLESGARPIPPGNKLTDIATALDVPLSQLLRDEADSTPPTVPIVGYVGAGAEGHFYATGSGGLGETEAPADSSRHTVAVEIRGVSLGPALESWIIFYDDVRAPVTPDLHGQLCVVGLPDDRILVKRLRSAGQPGRYHLESNSTEPVIFDQEVMWAAKVKGIRPR